MLIDRGFDAAEFLTELAGTGAAFLARLRSTRTLPVLARCDDGSHLSRIGELTVRVITVVGCRGWAGGWCPLLRPCAHTSA